jgi:hypothetical protein
VDRRPGIGYPADILVFLFRNPISFRCLMRKLFLLAGLALALPVSAQPADDDCRAHACSVAVSFASVSDSRSYGLLIAAPDIGCRRVRFRVEGAGEVFLGHTPPLSPGELAVVRLGRGFPAGLNIVTVASVGCDAPPAATRRVVLAKISPDHGWRAAN